MLGLDHRIVVLLFVHAKLALHSRFFVEHFPDRGRLVPTMLIGQPRQRLPHFRGSAGSVGRTTAVAVIVRLNLPIFAASPSIVTTAV